MNIILYDNQTRPHLLPFTFTRPVAEIRIGITKIREKWERVFKKECCFFTQSYLSELFPICITEDNLFIAGNLLPDEQLVSALKKLNKGEVLKDNQQCVLALRTGSVEEFKDLSNFKTIIYPNNVIAINSKHQIFLLNQTVFLNDFKTLKWHRKSGVLNASNKLIGDRRAIFIEEGAKIDGATLNCETGPIYIGKNAQIMENSCIRGPFALLDESVVKMGARIYGATTIGPYCKVGGEINNVVMFGYSNKAHDGYLGNAVIGEWCNIGAGSDASNLKNNYETIAQWNYNSNTYEDTGLQFCGLMMGDHSKCSIGSMFNSGTVVGVGCNLFGSDFHRSFIPSFSIGNRTKGYTLNRIDKVLETEKAMFLRRGMVMSEYYSKMISLLSIL
ncbi:MAG: glucose-1-phosphate thymidylyltransferase [Bacteroidales bacterium]|jgi:UDP-N-acetylglucosamine diphosphorylase/glucosamine-1-phosphate N-acetyltransferase|nr:glucose-1-phosphate thymidylyltransferase [Bacteroidales bacterium]